VRRRKRRPSGGPGSSSSSARCELADDAPALCVGAHNTNVDVDGNFAGQILVYELPLPPEFHILDDARARYYGDTVDRAEQIEGQHDLDGDGDLDMIIGAFFGESYNDGVQLGAVAVLLHPPEGAHRVWDVADATFVGVDPGAEFGVGTAAGDLDGDGYMDLYVGAFFGAAGKAYVFRGPFSGERAADEAEWQVLGQADDWLGRSGVVGDLDGDGAQDLAVAAPRSIYVGTEPGHVLIWPAPQQGVLDAAEAPIDRVSGVGAPDGFGMGLEGGDFDGDGRMDLAIGAPCDPTVGAYAGSVTVVFGASL
jgi:hypothetical protein